MDKNQLQSILSNDYQSAIWREVLTNVFGVKRLNQQPQPIVLPANEITENAFELGYLDTSDGRRVGLYQIEIKPKVRIERKKVVLRELLRNIYKNDVDGALVVFVRSSKWRLSFISEIRILTNDGSLETKATEPKRYTYLLGHGEKTKTPTDRIWSLAEKAISLDDIRTAFSVEALNKEFYQKVSAEFYKLVGATTGKAGKTTHHEKVMQLPGATAATAANRRLYQEFAVRLIGRTVFCWFLKKKESDAGVSLLSENLLSSDAVRSNKDYYHSILEPLFFQTLNTPTDKRIDDLPSGCETTPFLNGGLFEPQDDDFYNSESKTDIYHSFELKIPDSWFLDFFEKLEQYNFTIDENSPTEVEISVDPEMLGRIFENLLAEIDPDSGETARKATGSFYTPREIVNYMVDESLLIYLKSKLQTESFGFQAIGEDQPTFFGNEMRIQQKLELPLSNNRWQRKESELETVLRTLFAYGNDDNPFNETETEILIRAIDECKILDPAGGSGAFPMGILHRLVFLLDKLDKDNAKWKQWQKQKAIEETKTAFDDGDVNQREIRLLEINAAFEKDSSDFGRKLFLIENCIYGADIQPIAAEISKLRCFLTLIVDEDVVDDKPNRNVKPLPNLEFKFVTADALLKLPASGLFNSDSQLTKLEGIRHEYIQSYGEQKAKLKADFKCLQDAIFDEQLANFADNKDPRALALSIWNPFGHKKVDWFDPQWMFGVKAFDIVIGNPPYGAELSVEQIEKYKKEFILKTTETAILFIERGKGLLKNNGVQTFIIPKAFSYASNYAATRDLEDAELVMLGDCGKAFENVKLEVCVLLIQLGIKLGTYNSVKYADDKSFRLISKIDKGLRLIFGFFPNGISPAEIEVGLRILNSRPRLNDIASNSRGEMLQKHVVESGKIGVIGGKEINRYGFRSVKGYLNESVKINEKGFISKNSVLAQNIIAHITRPTDCIKIIACIPDYDSDDSFVIADTINQITIHDEKYSKSLIWAILNSQLIAWYAYRFIFGKAIRTMHFDNAVTSRIPIPTPTETEHEEIKRLVEQVIDGTKHNPRPETSLLEREIDQLIY